MPGETGQKENKLNIPAKFKIYNMASEKQEKPKFGNYLKQKFKNKHVSNGLDDANFVCYIQGIIIWSQPHICLLQPIGPD